MSYNMSRLVRTLDMENEKTYKYCSFSKVSIVIVRGRP